MTDLYLIAHKVRGEPAFDVAQHAICVHCQSYESVTGVWCEATTPQSECAQCDGKGYTWIIPTSGHGAHPYYVISLSELDNYGWLEQKHNPMPPDLPDHYPTRAEPQRSLVDLLGIKAKPQAPSAPIKRRF
jgi:hypothetical protein